MTRYFKHIFIFLLCVVCGVTMASAQITVSAPAKVAVGENFRLSYTIRTEDVDNFRLGSVPEGLELIAGPYTSKQLSYQMINGHTSSSALVTYNYTLYADKNGTYTISPAHATVDGKAVTSRSVKIVVDGKATNANNGTPKMHDDDDMDETMRTPTRITGKDLFIKVSANKRKVFEQEPVLLTYKVYTLVDLTQLEGKMPDLTGFHTQEIPLPQQKSFHMERVNGIPYRTVTWSQYLMYPQITGKLEVPGINFHGTVIQQNRSVDPFEAFFNGGSGYIEVNKNIQAPGLNIEVEPLPTKPADFSGGVGSFNISAQLSKTEAKAGEPITLRVVIGGVGNLKLIKFPTVNFSKDFDVYDPKITDKTKVTTNGVEGNMVYDILFVPRNMGKYTIPSIPFTYFDVKSRAYKTVRTRAFTVNVAKGDGRNKTESFDTMVEKDIRGLKSGDSATYDSTEGMFFGSTIYWVCLIIPFVSFIVLLVIFRKRAINNADVVKMRSRKADKIARKRLKVAKQLMQRGNKGAFYDEVLRALWVYAGYKLNMPVTDLARDNIAEAFASRGVEQKAIDQFIHALDLCEFERYSPSGSVGNMDHTYTSAASAIRDIEEVMKKKS